MSSEAMAPQLATPNTIVRINGEHGSELNLRFGSIPARNLQLKGDSRRLVRAFQRKTGDRLEQLRLLNLNKPLYYILQSATQLDPDCNGLIIGCRYIFSKALFLDL